MSILGSQQDSPMIPQNRRGRHPKHRMDWDAFPWDEYDRLIAEGLSESAIAWQVGIPQRTLNHARKRRERQGAPDITITDLVVEEIRLDPATASDRSHEILSSNSAPASHYIAPQPSTPQYDDRESRIAVLEAFMATLQRQPAYLPSTPAIALDRTEREWQKTGVELAADIRDALRDYAKAHGLQVREVLDQALRRYLNGHSRLVPIDLDAEGGER
jgi:hypothetical protein